MRAAVKTGENAIRQSKDTMIIDHPRLRPCENR